MGMVWPPFGADAATSDRLGRIALFVTVGFSPRYAVSLLETLARKFVPSGPAALEARAVPVNQVRGVDDDVANRLSEEGIATVTALSRANPIRLLRNTRYDKGLILFWIDNAILLETFPEAWKALERIGVIRASALVWYWLRAPSPTSKDDALDAIAEGASLDKTILRSTAARLAADAQVRMIMLLDDSEIETTDSGDDVISSRRAG
jgi:hypothetical protein